MSRRVILLPRVERDMRAASDWYEDQRAGLGDEVLTEIRRTFESVRTLPGRFVELRRGYRRALVERFPYAVVYRYDDEKVTVVTVYHTSQNPTVWKRRITRDVTDREASDDTDQENG